MGVTRIRRVRTARKKEMERALKWIIFPPAIFGALLFGTGKRKRRRK